jgi:hypothetical protein
MERWALLGRMKIRRIGNSLGVTLSKYLRAMGFRIDDSHVVAKMRNGIEQAHYDPDSAEALEAGRDFMRRFPKAMKKLAE